MMKYEELIIIVFDLFEENKRGPWRLELFKLFGKI